MQGYVKVYTDGRNEVKLVTAYARFIDFCFVLHNEKLISYGGVRHHRFASFYINHYGKEYKGRVVAGKRFNLREKGSELEIEAKHGALSLWLYYIPFGKSLTPYIEGGKSDMQCVILPELARVYKGRAVYVVSEPWGLQVRSSSDKFRVYLIMPDGREYLAYEGRRVDLDYRYSPKFFKVGDVMVVELKWVGKDLKKYFVQSPGLSYLFVEFGYKGNEKFARISFDLENWVEVKAERIVFKEDGGLRVEYEGEAKPWIFERNDIRNAIEKIRSYLIEEPEPELSLSLGG